MPKKKRSKIKRVNLKKEETEIPNEEPLEKESPRPRRPLGPPLAFTNAIKKIAKKIAKKKIAKKIAKKKVAKKIAKKKVAKKVTKKKVAKKKATKKSVKRRAMKKK